MAPGPSQNEKLLGASLAKGCGMLSVAVTAVVAAVVDAVVAVVVVA